MANTLKTFSLQITLPEDTSVDCYFRSAQTRTVVQLETKKTAVPAAIFLQWEEETWFAVLTVTVMHAIDLYLEVNHTQLVLGQEPGSVTSLTGRDEFTFKFTNQKI